MLFRRAVADGTLDQGVVGGCLGSFNLRMTGCAGTRRLGRFGVMRIVASDAGFPRVVRVRVDLGEAGRS